LTGSASEKRILYSTLETGWKQETIGPLHQVLTRAISIGLISSAHLGRSPYGAAIIAAASATMVAGGANARDRRYTTEASGSHWLQMRERQIAARENIEKAIKIIAGESQVDFISMTPVFHRAAAEDKMIHYSLDAHWNAEGREIAARFMADALKKRYPTSRHKEIEDQRITVPAK
jgi:hypothetical protein